MQTVKALVQMRATLVSDLEMHQGEIYRILRQLGGIDSTLNLFGYEADPDKIMRQHRRGEISRVILGIMRDAKRPVTAEEITEMVVAKRDLDPADRELRVAMLKRVRGCLARYRGKGMLQSRENKNSLLEWSVAGS